MRPAMLLMLMMLPVPRSAMAGANAPTSRNGARTLSANMESKSATFMSSVGAQTECPALLTRTSTATDLLRQVCDVGWVAQVGGDKASLTAGRLDLFDDRCAARRVAADDDDLHGVMGEAQGDGFAE